jgi:hypothetical protein
MGARGWGGRSGTFSAAEADGGDGNASGGGGGEGGEAEKQVATSTVALQEVERAHGVGGEVTLAAPHRNSRVSKTTIEQLRAQTEPDAWVGASATAAEASFASGATCRGMETLVHDYKRRRLGQRQEAPEWFEAVASDVPPISAWWQTTADLVSAAPVLEGSAAAGGGGGGSFRGAVTYIEVGGRRSGRLSQRRTSALSSSRRCSGAMW